MASLSESSLRPTPMVEPEATNPLARSISLPSQAPRASRAKQLFVSCARTLHDLPVAFLALVKAFRGLQRMGLNVTPNHYYWPVPDLAELEKREWPIYLAPPGSHFDLKKQAELARELSANYGAECCFSAEPHDSSYHYNNGYFEAVDAEVAYFMVRQFKPARIVEIGTGYSTRVLATALEKNSETDGFEGQLISIDPNPERFLKNGWRSFVVQIPRAIQEVELNFFDTLQSGDILFIDSSHVVSVGSDVLREYLQILPQLKPGVLVHIHDIFLPSDYPRDAVLKNLWFWSEQYLLQAFLSFNSEFEVLWGSSAMQVHYPWVLEQCFPSWKHSYRNMPSRRRRFVPTVDQDRVWPSSFWMRRH